MLSLSSSLARVSALFSGTGPASKTETSNTNAATSTESIPSGPCLSITGPATCLPAISSLPETRRLVISHALNELFTKRHFNICQLDAVAELLNAPRNTDAFKLLRTLHCVDYSDMAPELRDRIPLLVNECLTGYQPARHPATDLAMHGITL